MTKSAVIAENLTLGYKHHPVIENFSANIEMNAFVGIFGPNGAGKTTFLQSVLGLIKPLSGKLRVIGQAPESGNVNIGYVPQGLPNIHISISGRALLKSSIKGNYFGLPILSSESRAQVEEVIDMVDAQHYVDRPFAQLSGGEKRKLLIAQALLGRPSLLLLDEPLANVDPNYQYIIVELLDNIRKKLQITVLLTAHDINPLIKAMTNVLYLADKKAVIGHVEAVIRSDILSQLYGTPIEVIHHDGRIFVMHRSTGKTENAVCHH